jgi:aquaporin rerated protein, other eukaryote
MDWLPHGFRSHFIAMCGEFVGTWLFLFFALAGTQVANTTQVGAATQTSTSGTSLYIALSFGFSLAVNAWVFFRISGGLCRYIPGVF